MSFGWLKYLSPRSLIGRTALILLVPIITVQLVVSYVFIQRLYEDVTEQMTRSMMPSLLVVTAEMGETPNRETALAVGAETGFPLGILVSDAAPPKADTRLFYDLSGGVVTRVMHSVLPISGGVDLVSNERRVIFGLDTPHGAVTMSFERARVSARNPHQLLVLMVFVSTIVTLISFLFLKNQVRPIRKLAEAASAFGKGRNVPYRPAGATEVRQAGTSFLEMRDRIERHIEQRTLMLSGVSHDLRTPLTRMKLGLSLLPDQEDAAPLMKDVDDMQAMLDTFLGFARVEATETATEVDPLQLARDAAAQARSAGADVEIAGVVGEGTVEVRPMAISRAIENLIGNATRYGTKAMVSVTYLEKSVRITVEDDGPGIPESQRDEAMRPFTRLDPSRNQDKGGSVGLGLSIVRDIARQHGGSLRLGESKALGGLRADLVLAR
ncbi:MAG: ATP-binding protein [Pseudomonadota bacterium]